MELNYARHRKERKDAIYLGKVFSVSVDGEFDYPENHTWGKIYGRRYDRTYLLYRLQDEISEKSNNRGAILRKYDTEIDGVYIVVARCKKGSKLEKALNEMGFTTIKAAN